MGSLLSSAATESLLYLSHTIENVIISDSSKTFWLTKEKEVGKIGLNSFQEKRQVNMPTTPITLID